MLLFSIIHFVKKAISYIYLDSVDSTNSWAKANASTLDRDCLTCITALEQTAGRGQFSRKWHSPYGVNLYATFFCSLPKTFPSAANLGQTLALSCALVLQENGFHPTLKWPNDLLIAEKKVGGILTEVIDMQESLGAFLGIGLNVNMPEEELAKIDQPASSLLMLSGKSWDVNLLLQQLGKRLLHDLKTLQQQGFRPFCPLFNQLLAQRGKKMAQGVCQGVTDEGALEILLPSGKTAKILSGSPES